MHEVSEELADKLQKSCHSVSRCLYTFPALTLFWKVVVGLTAVLMLTFSLTLWTMATALSRYSIELHELRNATMANYEALGIKIDGHKQVSLENRVIQSEVRGMLNSYLGDLYRQRQEKK
jgi:hypothetical protein